ncbi:DUF1905 domain-containing protein [Sphingomonas sp. AOB5]|uniref:DUF1905 domain-containing protein n=1 Tax=Sphingomonas sp. AOB5 TaxID=3034017 RepID=UPI0023F7EB02|nr:DUF1905 domain-containing protein [Sphingomonas sp. AOB5]MDF7777235.1 DUF1905 domain-containing protein [Sphingomonas sp. AOB5]
MIPRGEILADISFSGEAFEWRGPAPFVFVAVPEEHTGEVRYAAQLASYGWGVVPVQAEIDGTGFRTSLFPRDGGYLLPLKVAVRKETGIVLGDQVTVQMRIASAY